MSEFSYATQRKIRIISEKLGENWRDANPGRSIDAIYNSVVGDGRKNLFCKLHPEIKDKLDTMVEAYDVKMSEFIEKLIETSYEDFQQRQDQINKKIVVDFSGS